MSNCWAVEGTSKLAWEAYSCTTHTVLSKGSASFTSHVITTVFSVARDVTIEIPCQTHTLLVSELRCLSYCGMLSAVSSIQMLSTFKTKLCSLAQQDNRVQLLWYNLLTQIKNARPNLDYRDLLPLVVKAFLDISQTDSVLHKQVSSSFCILLQCWSCIY